jgi:hypothetical protein
MAATRPRITSVTLARQLPLKRINMTQPIVKSIARPAPTTVPAWESFPPQSVYLGWKINPPEPVAAILPVAWNYYSGPPYPFKGQRAKSPSLSATGNCHSCHVLMAWRVIQ